MTSFTGSTAVGKRVAEIANRHRQAHHLELGGKGALVVFDDADLDAAVNGAVAGSLIKTRAGLHGRHARVRAAAPLRRVRPEDRRPHGERPGRRPLRPGHDLGPLISHVQRDRVAGFVDRGAWLRAAW